MANRTRYVLVDETDTALGTATNPLQTSGGGLQCANDVVAVGPNPASGATPSHITNLGAVVTVKAAAGTVYGGTFTNTGAAGFLQILNNASGSTLGSNVVWEKYCGVGSTTPLAIDILPGAPGLSCNTGIQVCFATTLGGSTAVTSPTNALSLTAY